MRFRSSDAGSGSLLAVGIVAALLVATVLLLPLALLTPVKHRVKDAADAAALAAADVAVGLRPGVPCGAAEMVAAGNGAELIGCQVDGLIATVTTRIMLLGIPLAATSSAGPPAPV